MFVCTPTQVLIREIYKKYKMKSRKEHMYVYGRHMHGTHVTGTHVRTWYTRI